MSEPGLAVGIALVVLAIRAAIASYRMRRLEGRLEAVEDLSRRIRKEQGEVNL